eukprot:4978162-Ditylum_brightwellii.AAC.1
MCDVAGFPSGCAATLISDMTHYCLFKIPTGKVLTSVPYDRSNTCPLLKQRWKASWRKYFLLIMDEDSMVGRGIWAWPEHRVYEARKYISPNLIVRGQNDVTTFHCLSKEQLDHPWGGIP